MPASDRISAASAQHWTGNIRAQRQGQGDTEVTRRDGNTSTGHATVLYLSHGDVSSLTAAAAAGMRVELLQYGQSVGIR